MLNGIKTVIAVNRLDVRAIHYHAISLYYATFAILCICTASLETCGFHSSYTIVRNIDLASTLLL